MPERNGRDLLTEWRQVAESVLSSAASAASRAELPGDLLRATQRQLDLLGQIVEREQRLQGGLLDGLLAPVDAVFDLLADSGATLRRQAETLETAGRALQETAVLMKQQAEMFERTISILRQPTTLARSAAKGSRRRHADASAEHAPESAAKAPAKRSAKSAPAKRSTGSSARGAAKSPAGRRSSKSGPV
ncbi:MAG TPA: hypothetical protein VKG82_02245 [Solirubrobacteraceae bacterium]|nr:hypothetical protein [Solirubrobacteraceae bacterium]